MFDVTGWTVYVPHASGIAVYRLNLIFEVDFELGSLDEFTFEVP